MIRLIILLLTFSLFVFSCSTTKELEKEEMEVLLDQATVKLIELSGTEVELESGTELDFDLRTYRSRLSDNYAMLQNTVPESFRNVQDQEERRNSNHGFRVQILSTPDIQKADSIQREFIIWLDTVEIDYQAETYVTFRQPNFRVHVGDFSGRSDAILFSQFVRQKYPHAWVVHDRINPEQTPEKQMAEKEKDKEDEIRKSSVDENEEPELRKSY